MLGRARCYMQPVRRIISGSPATPRCSSYGPLEVLVSDPRREAAIDGSVISPSSIIRDPSRDRPTVSVNFSDAPVTVPTDAHGAHAHAECRLRAAAIATKMNQIQCIRKCTHVCPDLAVQNYALCARCKITLVPIVCPDH